MPFLLSLEALLSFFLEAFLLLVALPVRGPFGEYRSTIILSVEGCFVDYLGRFALLIPLFSFWWTLRGETRDEEGLCGTVSVEALLMFLADFMSLYELKQ